VVRTATSLAEAERLLLLPRPEDALEIQRLADLVAQSDREIDAKDELISHLFDELREDENARSPIILQQPQGASQVADVEDASDSTARLEAQGASDDELIPADLNSSNPSVQASHADPHDSTTAPFDLDAVPSLSKMGRRQLEAKITDLEARLSKEQEAHRQLRILHRTAVDSQRKNRSQHGQKQNEPAKKSTTKHLDKLMSGCYSIMYPASATP